MFLKLEENDLYFFDAEAGERAIRFIEKYLRHYEDAFAGKPFLLMEWQKKVVRDLFGWKRRVDGLRRFREVFMLMPKVSTFVITRRTFNGRLRINSRSKCRTRLMRVSAR